jgi:hypothetical protein
MNFAKRQKTPILQSKLFPCPNLVDKIIKKYKKKNLEIQKNKRHFKNRKTKMQKEKI